MLAGENPFLLSVSIAGIGQISPPPIGDGKGPCTAADKPCQHIVSGFWLAPVCFDLICTFLAVWKVRGYFLLVRPNIDSLQAATLQKMAARSPIVKVFVHEGLGCFFVGGDFTSTTGLPFTVLPGYLCRQRVGCRLCASKYVTRTED